MSTNFIQQNEISANRNSAQYQRITDQNQLTHSSQMFSNVRNSPDRYQQQNCHPYSNMFNS